MATGRGRDRQKNNQFFLAAHRNTAFVIEQRTVMKHSILYTLILNLSHFPGAIWCWLCHSGRWRYLPIGYYGNTYACTVCGREWYWRFKGAQREK